MISKIVEKNDKYLKNKNVNNDKNNFSVRDSFSYLCNYLSKKIRESETIEERSLLAFNKLSVLSIKNNINIMTMDFQRLYNDIQDVWRFGLQNIKSEERRYSYVRLYQIVNTIDTAHKDLESAKEASLKAVKKDMSEKLIKEIMLSPGINRREIQNLIQISDDKLAQYLQILLKEGYAIDRRSKDEQFYVLTNKGETLYRYLVLKNCDEWLDLWSKERLGVLFMFVFKLRGHGLSIYDIIRCVSELSDSQIFIIENCLFYKEKNLKEAINPTFVATIEDRSMNVILKKYDGSFLGEKML